jgi:hypothetical protein
MTTSIVIVILLMIVALVALGVLWDSWRSGRAFCTPIPRPYKGRGSQEAVWRDRCGDGFGEADSVVTLLCDAFSFNPDDRFKFGPDDQVMDIYRARYPRWKGCWSGDCMEIESLMVELEEQYGISVEDWHADISLGDLVELAGEKRGD